MESLTPEKMKVFWAIVRATAELTKCHKDEYNQILKEEKDNV